jgi:hypothetical protein
MYTFNKEQLEYLIKRDKNNPYIWNLAVKCLDQINEITLLKQRLQDEHDSMLKENSNV